MNIANLFGSIKAGLDKPDTNNKRDDDYLHLEPNSKVVVKLLPYITNPSDTIVSYYVWGFKSTKNGVFMQPLSPSSFGEKCPIAEYRYRVWKAGTEDEKTKIKGLNRINKYMANVLVVSDSHNPENDGKVKILRFGNQIYDKVQQAINEDEEMYGSNIFDLKGKGGVLRILIEKQGEYTTYKNSSFTLQTVKLPEGETEDSILAKCKDLKSQLKVKSYDDLVTLLKEHFIDETPAKNDVLENALNNVAANSKPAKKSASKTVGPVTDDDVDISDEELNSLIESVNV